MNNTLLITYQSLMFFFICLLYLCRIIDDDQLRKLYHMHGKSVDAMDHILEVFHGRSERSIRNRLRKLGLEFANPREWTEKVILIN